MWNANLTPPGTDADWYRLDVDTAFCAVAEVFTHTPGQLTLAAQEDRSPGMARLTEAGGGTQLALAAPAGNTVFLGLEPASMMLLSSDTESAPSPGRYTFSLDAMDYAQLDPEGDGESPEAGDTPTTAASLGAGCAAGSLSAADQADHRIFDVDEAREVGFSLARAGGANVELRVVSPSGATRLTLRSGESGDVWADEPGRWTAIVAPLPTSSLSASALGMALSSPTGSALDDAYYLLGVVDGPPGEPDPCSPTCR